MEGIYIYTEIEIEKLYPGVFRPQSWLDEHPLFMKLVDELKKSIIEEGLKYPLCAVNLKDDGTYEVTSGNRRLIALQEIKAKIIPCIIANKPAQKFVPKGKILNTQQEILNYFGGTARNICLNPNIFSVAPIENWDEHKMFKE